MRLRTLLLGLLVLVVGVVIGVVITPTEQGALPVAAGDAGAGSGTVVVEYPDVPDDLAALQDRVADSGLLEAAGERLTERVALPVDLTLQVRSCDDGTGYLQGEQLIEMCLEDLATSRQELADGEVEDLETTEEGIWTETFFHEAGHAVIDVFSLPYTGREEDVSDQFAAWMLAGSPEEGSVEALLAASTEYQVLAAAYEQDATDEHASDAQRAVNYLCYVYGSDPETWADLVDDEPLTDDRAEDCEDEWQDVDRGWRDLLDDADALRPG